MKLHEMLSAAAGVGVAGGIVAAGDAGGWPGASLALVFALAAATGILAALAALRLSAQTPVSPSRASDPAAAAAAEPAS